MPARVSDGTASDSGGECFPSIGGATTPDAAGHGSIQSAANMSSGGRNQPVSVSGEEEWPGHPVRSDRRAAHYQGDERVERKESHYLLSEATT